MLGQATMRWENPLLLLSIFLAAAVHAQAPTDDELKALEQQIQQQESVQAEAKKRAAAEAKRKAEAQAKRQAEEAVQAEAAAKAAAEAEATAKAAAEAEAQKQAQQYEALAGKFVSIPSGSFQMGCSPGDGECKPSEYSVHTVMLKSFRMGKYEITQAQWHAVMGSNPSKFQGCDNCPVEQVSWDDVQGFIQKLNQQTGNNYRLPSEAEWEYAARAGTNTTRFWGSGKEEACRYANVFDQAGKAAHPDFNWENFTCNDGYGDTALVGTYQANAFGLYDMLGNVWEWTQDCWNDYYSDAPSDGSARSSGNCSQRVLRGGSWSDIPGDIRSSPRARLTTGERNLILGFRLVQD